jgi:ribulose-5-phosphate 4-epimerase/fuculose-1-phosphate aldolase
MGTTVAKAFELMFFLERACQIQIAALAGGSAVIHPAQSVCERTSAQFGCDDTYVQGRDWQALLRLLDRIDSSYKE